MKDDLISRQAAINAMTCTLWHYPDECYRNLNEYEFARGLAELGLKSVPSAQPDAPDINDGDMISRRAAIRWVKTECNPYGDSTLDFESGKKVIKHLEQMPSAQLEIIHCGECKHNNDCNIQYAAQGGELFYCGAAERQEE